ncbi:hypothetical protein GLOIN_2v1489223 [Rhizophagus irregularis DAOM 181602=DAOM 197198]|uniref:Uncharacterized protein n=1 Tax=Rhizophagus irregularis (strain DAOM 181602 / DAOM 197198 / MUCL 43194) TaxID=747089 RepID=A0A2P4NWU7_RHIID|nr:hypothetical protein GLOIN_2v1489223 [Rhizophagus irregularis DAOM 181602=DAOM 197198]POG57619.1 hypothetical protein GLOIN_2v1489223 [Rhizophagus irregularis DAOM 181602=DAOM 197198]|eukprot:XP_025164485.1 hypothetical protein GLOIN_2v1489223 [Rhizophagus irregularis DAOM 181602=DAOM 197198]
MTDHSLAIILQKLSSLEKTVQEIKGEVENNLKELKDVKDKVEKLNEKVKKLDEKVKKLDEKVKKLDKRIEKLDEKVEKLRTENGHTFKMIARNEIAKKHGQHYSEGFVVFDVNGLVRLSTPKEKLSSKELEYDNQEMKLIDKFEKNLKRAREVYPNSNWDNPYSRADKLIKEVKERKDKTFNSQYDDGFDFVKKKKGYNYYINHIPI